MGQFTPFTKVLVIIKDHGADVDVSNAFTVIEWIEAVPQTAKITLIGYLGQFLTIAPKIQHWDRIYLEYEGVDGNTESDVFHVQNISRTDLAGGGIKLVLTCPHQTSNIWKKSVSLTIRRRSNFTSLEKVIEQLNLTKGANDPTILSPTFDIATKLGNNLSQDTFNDYTFEMKKLSNTFNEIGDKEGQPIEGGGKFQPPYIRFKSNYDHGTGLGLDEVNIQAYAQGFNKNVQSATFTNVPNITLSHFPRSSPTIDVDKNNILETDSDEDPERATNIILRGGINSGDYLGDWTKYQGALDFFNRAREWDSTITFSPGAFVVGSDGNRYEAIAESTNESPPNVSYWIQRLFVKPLDFNLVTNYLEFATVVSEKIVWKSTLNGNVGNLPGSNDTWIRVFYQPPTDYSPETKGRAQDWINALAGSKYADLDTGQTRAIDANCIILDELHPRTYVRFVGKDPTLIPSSLKQGGGTIIPDAFKVLVVEPNYGNDPPTATDTGEGEFAGNDLNGIPFAGNVAQYVDPEKDGTGTWFVFKGRETAQDQEIIDFDEDISWVKKPCQGLLSFVDGTGTCNIGTRNEGWVGGSYQLVTGIDVTPIFGDGAALTQFGQFVDNRPFECAHRIKYDTINNRIDAGNKGILADDDSQNSAFFIKTEPDATPGATQLFDWNRGIWLNFWSLTPVSSNAIPFGAVTVGEIVNLATFDFDNLNRGPDGTLDMFGPEIETRYPIQAFASWVKLITTFGSGSLLENTLDSKGDYSMAIFLVDRNDNIREIDFPLGKTNDTLSLEGNLPGSQYKGIPGIPLFFSGKEPDTTDAFDIKEFVFGGIFSKDSYDDQGRYEINGSTFLLKSEVELDIDGWRKTKPLIITNNDIASNLPSRNIETNTQDNESITRYAQGKNLVLGLEKLFTFKRQKFDLTTSGRSKIDLRHGDPVYVTNPEMIDETTDGLPNTLLMVVDKITRTFSRAPKGPGGVEEKYSLITRLFPD